MQDFIDEIESINLKDSSAYQTLLAKFKSLEKLHFPTITILPNEKVFAVRARELDIENDFLYKISDHSYNPNPFFTTQGRVNKPDQIIFYARSDFAGALAECGFMSGKNIGERVTFSFSSWRVVKKLKVISIFNPRDINVISRSSIREHIPLTEFKQKNLIGTEKTEHVQFLEYISNKFRKPIHKGETYKYKITSAYANMLFELDQDLAGIIYQSVQFKNRYNLAIRKQFLDENYFAPVDFSKGTYLIKDKGLEELSFTQAKRFDSETGEIKW